MTITPNVEKTFDDVTSEDVLIGQIEATIHYPTGARGRLPAIVIGAEATGVNIFIRNTARELASAGFVTIVPDYYRGNGPADPENYTDLDDIMRHVDAIDFPSATHVLTRAFHYLTKHPLVDPDRIGLWGYCTGATLAWLAASVRHDAALAMLFYPSQPVFTEPSLERPVSPIDLLWNVRCPFYLIYGTADYVMPPELLEQTRQRLTRWGVEHEIKIYEGCAHSFAAPIPGSQNVTAYASAWAEAKSYAIDRLRAGEPRKQEED